MSGRLEGKRVLVTHAERFMGAPVAARFREEGADVVTDTSIPRSRRGRSDRRSCRHHRRGVRQPRVAADAGPGHRSDRRRLDDALRHARASAHGDGARRRKDHESREWGAHRRHDLCRSSARHSAQLLPPLRRAVHRMPIFAPPALSSRATTSSLPRSRRTTSRTTPTTRPG